MSKILYLKRPLLVGSAPLVDASLLSISTSSCCLLPLFEARKGVVVVLLLVVVVLVEEVLVVVAVVVMVGVAAATLEGISSISVTSLVSLLYGDVDGSSSK